MPELSAALIQALREAVPGGVGEGVPLDTVSGWRIGGVAGAIVEPGTPEEAASVVRLMSGRQEPFCVVGDTSNVLFDSAGFDGVLMRIWRRMSSVTIHGTRVVAEAGVSVPELAQYVGRSGLTGIEHTVGIPGTLGGLVVMNGGSLRRGIGESVESVRVVTREGDIMVLSWDECAFAYRSSALQSSGSVVIEATLRLERGEGERIGAEMLRIIESRQARFPTSASTCGSTFLSDPAMYESLGAPGEAIERVGLKGFRRGDAQISDVHANFFVNRGQASSDDMLWLIALARNAVRQATGFTMNCEVRYISPDGHVQPAHEAAERRWGAEVSRDDAR